MNILKKELKTNFKAFFWWSIGLFLIVFAGMTKYTGFAGETSVIEIFDAFPKIILAIFGMVNIDVSSIGGFYAIVVYYGIICIAIYGISLGVNAVNRESIDKTYEFIFTKPCSREYILSMKLISALLYLTIYSLFNYFFSMASIAALNLENTISTPILLYSIAMWIIGILFCSLSLFIATIIKKMEQGILFSNLVFLLVFILGMVYDILDDGWFIRIFTPLKYFLPNEILEGILNAPYAFFSILLSLFFYLVAINLFKKKDLQA